MRNAEEDAVASGYAEAKNVYCNQPSLAIENKAFDSDFSVDSEHQNPRQVPVNYLRMDKRTGRLPSLPPQEIKSSVAAPDKPIRSDYEELPNFNRNQDDLSGYTHIDDGSIVVGIEPYGAPRGIFNSDGRQHLVSQKNEDSGRARRRSNPLYQYHISCQSPSIDQKQTPGTCCCYGIQTLGFLLSVAALVLAVISVIAEIKSDTKYEQLARKYDDLKNSLATPADGSNNSDALQRSSDVSPLVQQLLLNNTELQQEINSLQVKLNSLEILFGYSKDLLQNLTFQIASQTNQLNLMNTVNANITQTVDDVRRDLTFQIYQIPHGLANFSLCSHQFRDSGTSAYLPQSSTDPLNLTNSVVLGVVCSTDGGTQAFLESNSNSPNVYTCVCRGQLYSNTTSRFCTIHYWSCPIIP